MRGLALIFTLHFGQEHPGGDRWLSADKAKHFFTAALAQTMSFSAFRAVGLSRRGALVGATLVTGALSVGKEVYDQRTGGDPSLKDLSWDAAGMAAASALLAHTER
jgi:uncharacterized protein YfiM (DUF2279 family)